jgi:hypothetical protein
MARHVPSSAGNETSEDFETLFVSFPFPIPTYQYSLWLVAGVWEHDPHAYGGTVTA